MMWRASTFDFLIFTPVSFDLFSSFWFIRLIHQKKMEGKIEKESLVSQLVKTLPGKFGLARPGDLIPFYHIQVFIA